MVGQDFDSDPVTPAHHAFLGGGLMPWLVLGALLLGFVAAMLFVNAGRERRLDDIWRIIDGKVRAAVWNGEARAAEMMIDLRHTIRSQLGNFVLEGHLAHKLKMLDDALNKSPKAPDLVAGAHGATVSGRFAVTDHTLVPQDPPTSPSTNAQAFKAANEFDAYWKQKSERMADLRELQSKLTRG